MWAWIILILGDQSAIMVAGTCLVTITIGLVVAYLVKLLDKVIPRLGSRLSLIPIAAMSFLVSSTMWIWINNSILLGIVDLHNFEKIMLLSMPVILAIVIMAGWILNNLDSIRGQSIKE